MNDYHSNTPLVNVLAGGIIAFLTLVAPITVVCDFTKPEESVKINKFSYKTLLNDGNSRGSWALEYVRSRT